MTPTQKAEELVNKFKKYSYYPKTNDDTIFVNELNNNAKQCALIAVDEILSVIWIDLDDRVDYWTEIKQKIENI